MAVNLLIGVPSLSVGARAKVTTAGDCLAHRIDRGNWPAQVPETATSLLIRGRGP